MLKTSSTTRSAKNLSSNMTEDIEIGDSDHSDRNKTIKRSFSNLNKNMGYLTLDARKTLSNWGKDLPMLLLEMIYMTSNDFGRCYPIAYSPQKMILKLATTNNSESQYKI